MLQSLFRRARNDDWTRMQPRIERTCVRLFAGIGLQARARALRVPQGSDSLLLVELISDVHWSSESLDQAKDILLLGLNSELGFKLRPEDLVIGFTRNTARRQVADEAPRPGWAPSAPPSDDFVSSLEVTEVGDSEWSAFGPTAAGALSASDGPDTIAVPRRAAPRADRR